MQEQPQNGSLESRRRQAERSLPPQQAHSLQSGSWLLSNRLPQQQTPFPPILPPQLGLLTRLCFLKGPAVPCHLRGSDSPMASEWLCDPPGRCCSLGCH